MFYFHSEWKNNTHEIRLVMSIETLELTGETPDSLTREVVEIRNFTQLRQKILR